MKELLGKRIKELRIKNGMTQEQLAELVGMGERNLSKIECGINFISAETLDKLTKALKVSPKELFDFDHLKGREFQKNEIIEAIKKDEIDINLLFRIYQSIKK
ncbi:MAG: helix-turn-helix transcriptional regulator [bacterium]|nr:helix-turn-helix transcriptional regulator [bacterium]